MYCFQRQVIPAVRRKNDDKVFVFILSSNLPGGFDPIHFRHSPVCENQVVGILFHFLDVQQLRCFFTAQTNISANAGVIEYDLGMLSGNLFIVDDEYMQ